jgi:hypothetical protein
MLDVTGSSDNAGALLASLLLSYHCKNPHIPGMAIIRIRVSKGFKLHLITFFKIETVLRPKNSRKERKETVSKAKDGCCCLHSVKMTALNFSSSCL